MNIMMFKVLNKQQKQLLNRFSYCKHESELPADILKTIIDLNNYDEIYIDVTKYLYTTYIKLNNKPIEE